SHRARRSRVRLAIDIGRYGFQFHSQITGRLPAALRILIEAMPQKFRNSWVQIHRQPCELWIADKNRSENFRYGFALERRVSRQHLVEHASKREHVAARIG